MKTNYEMYRVVKDHYIENEENIEKGLLDKIEGAVIRETFLLEERSILDLRNLRDFVVAITYSGIIDSTFDKFDMQSAIVFLIDHAIIDKGGDI